MVCLKICQTNANTVFQHLRESRKEATTEGLYLNSWWKVDWSRHFYIFSHFCDFLFTITCLVSPHTHTHTHTHTHIYIYIYTYIYTHIYIHTHCCGSRKLQNLCSWTGGKADTNSEVHCAESLGTDQILPFFPLQLSINKDVVLQRYTSTFTFRVIALILTGSCERLCLWLWEWRIAGLIASPRHNNWGQENLRVKKLCLVIQILNVSGLRLSCLFLDFNYLTVLHHITGLML